MVGQALGGGGRVVEFSFPVYQGFEVGEGFVVAAFDGVGYGVPVDGAVVEFEFGRIKIFFLKIFYYIFVRICVYVYTVK